MPPLRTGFEDVVGHSDRRVISGFAALTPRTNREDRLLNLFERVIVPLGLVEDPEPLLRHAAGLASRFHAEILLLQLIPATDKHLQVPGSAARLRSSLTKTAHSLVRAGAARVYAAMLEGSASRHIEDVARQHQASLIMLAEERDDSELNPWFGTVTQRLSRWAHIPLLVLKPHAPLTMSPLFCVIDFTESAREALRHAIRIARALQTKLVIYHGIPDFGAAINEHSLWNARIDAGDETAEREYTPVQRAEIHRKTESAREELVRFAGEFEMSGLETVYEVGYGSLVAKTISAARDHRAGLIVMGSGPRCGSSLIESQTPAEAVTEIADIPILIAHAPGAAVRAASGSTVFARKNL